MQVNVTQKNILSFGAGVVIASMAFVVAQNIKKLRFANDLPESYDWNLIGCFLGCASLAAAFIALVLYALPRRTAAPGLGHTQFRAGFPPERSSQAMRAEFEKQVGRFMLLIAQQLETSKDHIKSLSDANDLLAKAGSADDLKAIIASLMASNHSAISEAARLQKQLKDSQIQASDLRQRLNHAERLASLDPLTAIANRRRFEAVLQREVQHSHDYGTPLCVVMADIDHFKAVNDTYGHAVGDSVLIKFAELLTQQLRSTDLVARYGGEEFAIVLPRTPMGNAFDVVERVRLQIGDVDWIDGKDLNAPRLSASFGIAEIHEGESPELLVKRADEKLYEAKRKGRNRTVTWGSAA